MPEITQPDVRQTVFLAEGLLRVLTSLGHIDLTVWQGAHLAIDVTSPYVLDCKFEQEDASDASLVIGRSPVDLEPDPERRHLLLPMTDAEARLCAARDFILDIAHAKDDPERVNRLVNEALSAIDDDEVTDRPDSLVSSTTTDIDGVSAEEALQEALNAGLEAAAKYHDRMGKPEAGATPELIESHAAYARDIRDLKFQHPLI